MDVVQFPLNQHTSLSSSMAISSVFLMKCRPIFPGESLCQDQKTFMSFYPIIRLSKLAVSDNPF